MQRRLSSMRWIDLFLMSGGNLKRRKLRTFLTVLGVVIGTASVVAMLSLGLGLQQVMYSEVETYGSLTTLSIYGGGYDSEGSNKENLAITDNTLPDLAGYEHVVDVAPVYNVEAILLSGQYESGTTLIGLTPEGFRSMNLDLEWGELPEGNSGALDLVFGNTVVSGFYDPQSGSSPYYDNGELVVDLQNDSMFMIMDTENYWNSKAESFADTEIAGGYDPGTELIGEGTGTEEEMPVPVKAKKYSVKASALLSGGPDSWGMNSYAMFCDLDTLRSVLKKEFKGRSLPGQPQTATGMPTKEFVYSYAIIKVDDLKNVESLAKTYRDMGYEVQSQAEWVEQMKNQMKIIQLVLGGIGAVSLLVAAIGIANTMMMAIYERTREIGVMKVIGCSLKNIKQMFLIESACIGLLGGVIGNILGFGISAIVNNVTKGMMGEEMGVAAGISYIPPWLVLAALGIASFVGIASGFFPALRAMRLSPLAAIRNE
jgi:ABC-type antimicrobial peptide transport system permease subunit